MIETRKGGCKICFWVHFNIEIKPFGICIENFVQEQWLKQERVAAKSVFEFILIKKLSLLVPREEDGLQ